MFGLLEARLSSCSVDGLLRAVGFAGGGGVLELLGCCNDLVTEGTVSVRRGVVIVIEKDVEEIKKKIGLRKGCRRKELRCG